MTGDSQLKPYVELGRLRAAPASTRNRSINFIAAYGTHATHHQRDHAGGQARGSRWPSCWAARARLPDRLDFLNSTGAWASGGQWRDHHRSRRRRPLDRRPRPRSRCRFGGLLGSTFNFVFENQLENAAERRPLLLPGRAPPGCNFVTELENNSFAKLIMAQYRRDASAGRRVLDAGVHPRGRSDQAVQRGLGADGGRSDRRTAISRRW